jgi:hypothetical protein
MAWPVPAEVELSGAVTRVTPLDPVADAPALFAALDHDPVWEHLAGRPDNPERYAQTLRTRHAQKTDVRNVRSQQAIARLGATYEGTLRRYQRRGDGSLRDTVLFSITTEECPGVQQQLRARLAGAVAGPQHS